MSKIKIAVLSDLHCCHSTTEGADRSRLLTDSHRLPSNQHVVESLIKLIQENNISCDYVICPGDLTNRVDKQGLITGFSFITEIESELSASGAFCIPGNHDVDSRNKLGLSSAHEFLKQMNSKYPFAEEELKCKFWADHFCIYEDDAVELLFFDSTFNHTDEIKANQAIITETELNKIESEISKLKDSRKIKIFICHHHPILYANIDSISYKDSDFIQNGDKLLALLEKYNYEVIIHGHKHIPRYSRYNSIHLFASGSFSSLENLTEISARNSFHIIEFESLDINLHKEIKATINTWYFILGKGWKFSADPDSIFPSYTGFGNLKHIDIIAKEVAELFGEKQRLKFEFVLEKVPDLKFLPPNDQIKLEDILYKDFGVQFLNPLGTKPTEISKILI